MMWAASKDDSNLQLWAQQRAAGVGSGSQHSSVTWANVNGAHRPPYNDYAQASQ